MKKYFNTINSELLYSRENDPRISKHIIQSTELLKNNYNYTIVGYPDDEGIKLNKGRIGAAFGPDSIRKYLYKMIKPNKLHSNILDLGNLKLEQTLAKRHDIAKKSAYQNFKDDKFQISLGGGHDYGYPDCAGFITAEQELNNKPIVINLDAHLDVRPVENSILSSGTPFYRILEEYIDIDFIEVGIQDLCNQPDHYKWCEEKNCKIFELHTLYSSNVFNPNKLFKYLLSLNTDKPSNKAKRPLFISLDIDIFSCLYAPGCSQSWVSGLDLSSTLQIIDFLFTNFSVKGLGVYEVSPPLDSQNITSKLAAQIIYETIKHTLK